MWEVIMTPAQSSGVFCGVGRGLGSTEGQGTGPGWGRGAGQGPHHTTGKRMAPQQIRSTRNKISFQSP